MVATGAAYICADLKATGAGGVIALVAAPRCAAGLWSPLYAVVRDEIELAPSRQAGRHNACLLEAKREARKQRRRGRELDEAEFDVLVEMRVLSCESEFGPPVCICPCRLEPLDDQSSDWAKVKTGAWRRCVAARQSCNAGRRRQFRSLHLSR